MANMEEPEELPKILLCGLQGCGKTSILKVVFHKMSPHETMFLESTSKVDAVAVTRNAIVRFNVMDFPGGGSVLEESSETDRQEMLKSVGVVVFVISAQEEPYHDALALAKKVIEASHKINPKISFDILIHKVDGDNFYSDDQKTEIQRDIHSKLTEDLSEKIDAQIAFHCTSIYDHTVFEAMSKVVQKLIPNQLPILEQALDMLVSNSRMEKAYLFDVVSKVYIASDSLPVDLTSYELCADMIDVVIDVSCIYGLAEDGNQKAGLPADAKSSCVIQLNNGRLLYLREVDKCLALVCILREENFDRQYLLDHNIKVFKETLAEIFKVPVGKPAAPEAGESMISTT